MAKGGLELLADPVARQLLVSKIPARLAYTWTDGTPLKQVELKIEGRASENDKTLFASRPCERRLHFCDVRAAILEACDTSSTTGRRSKDEALDAP